MTGRSLVANPRARQRQQISSVPVVVDKPCFSVPGTYPLRTWHTQHMRGRWGKEGGVRGGGGRGREEEEGDKSLLLAKLKCLPQSVARLSTTQRISSATADTERQIRQPHIEPSPRRIGFIALCHRDWLAGPGIPGSSSLYVPSQDDFRDASAPLGVSVSTTIVPVTQFRRALAESRLR